MFDEMAGLLASLLPAPYKALAIITAAIKKAVEVSETLWQSGSLTEDQRKAKATELVNAALTLEKLTTIDKIAQAVSLAIDLAVILFLPKSHTVPADNEPTATDAEVKATTSAA